MFWFQVFHVRNISNKKSATSRLWKRFRKSKQKFGGKFLILEILNPEAEV